MTPDMDETLHRLMVGIATMADGLRQMSRALDSGHVTFNEAKSAIREVSRALDCVVAEISA